MQQYEQKRQKYREELNALMDKSRKTKHDYKRIQQLKWLLGEKVVVSVRFCPVGRDRQKPLVRVLRHPNGVVVVRR
jgi:hypothetical protein